MLTDSQPVNEDADSALNWLPRGVGDGWGVSEAVEGFVTTLATELEVYLSSPSPYEMAHSRFAERTPSIASIAVSPSAAPVAAASASKCPQDRSPNSCNAAVPPPKYLSAPLARSPYNFS